MLIGVVIVTALSIALPRADWRSLAVHTTGARVTGLVILLAATVLTVWARVVLIPGLRVIRNRLASG